MTDQIINLAERRGETHSLVDVERQALLNLGIPEADVWAYITSTVVAAVNGVAALDSNKRFHNLNGQQEVITQFLSLSESPTQKFCALWKLASPDQAFLDNYELTNLRVCVKRVMRAMNTNRKLKSSPPITEINDAVAEIVLAEYPCAQESLEAFIQGQSNQPSLDTPNVEVLGPHNVRKKAETEWCELSEQYLVEIKLRLSTQKYNADMIDALIELAVPSIKIPNELQFRAPEQLKALPSIFVEHRNSVISSIDWNSFVLSQPGIGINDIPTLKDCVKAVVAPL